MPNFFQRADVQKTVVALTDNTTTVYTGKARLHWIHVAVAISAHLTLIKDDTTTVGGLPTSAAAGQTYTFDPPMPFDTSIVIDPDDAATAGTITVGWAPNHDGSVG